MSDLFQTDMSWLDIGEQDPAPIAKSKRLSTAQLVTWGHPTEIRQKISQAQKGHKRHTDRSRQAISDYHKRPDSVLRSAEMQAKRTKGIRRSRANPSAKLQALWAAGCPQLVAANQKPIMTPTGVFPSVKHAAEWALANGLCNPYKKIGKWLKTHPEMFYYIKDTK